MDIWDWMSRQAGNTLGEAMRGTVGKMKMKTTKTLARSDYEGAVLLRLFIPGTDLCQLADTAVAAVALCYGFLAPTPTQVQRDTWQRGEQMGPGGGTFHPWHHPRRTRKRPVEV